MRLKISHRISKVEKLIFIVASRTDVGGAPEPALREAEEFASRCWTLTWDTPYVIANVNGLLVPPLEHPTSPVLPAGV